MKLSVRMVAVLLVCVVTREPGSAFAGDEWWQFRGPQGTGIADAANPPIAIGPEKNVRWKVPVPPGLSSPIVVGDLLVLTALDDNKLVTIAYRRVDGSEAWRAVAPCEKFEPYHPQEGSPAASTPASDGKHIVSYFGSCGLYCYDLGGHELWNYPLPPAATIADFGTGVSPILADGVVVLLRDESQSPMLLALDVQTGDKLWETKRESISGFGSPTVWETDSGTQIVAPGYGRLIAYDLKSGAEVWSIEGMPSSGCTTPVVAGDLLLYAGWSPGDASESDGFKMPTFDDILSGNNADADGNGELSKAEGESTMIKDFFDSNDPNKDGKITREEWDQMLAYMARSKNSAFAVSPGGTGDITETHVVWRQKTGLPYVPTAICYRDKLIMVKDGGIVTAYEAQSGDEFSQFRLAATGGYYASPVASQGRVYFTSLPEGAITVLGLTDKGLETLAENPPLGERVSATPAIVEDTLFVRTAGHLYAFGE
jgi:outer membrane protein assembly factor BamB